MFGLLAFAFVTLMYIGDLTVVGTAQRMLDLWNDEDVSSSTGLFNGKLEWHEPDGEEFVWREVSFARRLYLAVCICTRARPHSRIAITCTLHRVCTLGVPRGRGGQCHVSHRCIGGKI